MRHHRWLIGPALLLSVLPALAQGLKPFQTDSLAQITAAREGRPFLLLLWSLDCPPCLKELGQLQELAKTPAAQGLVLVSTDGPAQRADAQRTLQRLGLERLDNWIFADDFAARLRYHIDPDWFGELPRAYFYGADHRRTAKSGVLNPQWLQHWLQQRQPKGP